MEMIMAGGSPEMLERVYNNEVYKKAIRTWLPFLNKRGYLDTLLRQSETVKANEED